MPSGGVHKHILLSCHCGGCLTAPHAIHELQLSPTTRGGIPEQKTLIHSFNKYTGIIMILYCIEMCAGVCGQMFGQWDALKRFKGLGIRTEAQMRVKRRIFLGLIRATATPVAGPFSSERGCWSVAVAIRRTADAQLGGWINPASERL